MRSFFWKKIQDIYTVLDHLRDAVNRATGGPGFQRTATFLELGLVADGVTDNALAFAQAQMRRSRFTRYGVNATDREFAFGPLPPEYNATPLTPGGEGVPVAINLGTYGGTLFGEHMTASVIKLLPGTAGIYIPGGITAGVPSLDNFTIQGPGIGTLSDGKTPEGEWSQEHKHYKYGGIIANSQFHMDRVVVRDTSGDALSIVGFSDITPTGIPIKFRGQLRPMEDQPQYFVFHPAENTYDLAELRIGWRVTVQGVYTNIPFNSTGNTIYLNGRPEMVAGEDVEIEVRPQGGKMIADCSSVTRCAFINNGSGGYIQGDDSNQTHFAGNSWVGNGWLAFDDLSFLGTQFTGGEHIASNGKNFNKWKGQNGWEGEDEKRVPAFRVANPTASTTIVGMYVEGDQGQPEIAKRAFYFGGECATGLKGDGTWWINGELNRLNVGPVKMSAAGLELRDGTTQPLTYTLTPEGLPAFSFGPHPVLQFVRPGTAYAGIPAPLGAIVAPEYRLLGGASILSAVSLQEHLKTLGERPARTGQVLIISEPTPGPQSYLCRTGGDADACLFEPQGIGRGSLADRPAPETLTRHDVGYKWLSTATGVESTLVGTAWAEPAPPALEPPTADFIPDSSPLVYYSEGDWQHHQNNDFRNGDAVTRAPTPGPGFIEHAFTSQGQADEWIARHLVIDDNHLFAVFLNGEKVLERTAPGPAVASFGDRLIQHFVSAQFWNGQLERFPSFVLQPAAGENRLRVESYTPGAPAQNFYDDGTSCCLRGKMAQA